MQFPKLVYGYFIQRDNRFRASVLLEGHEVKVHVRNSGRLQDLFTLGRRVWLAPATKAGRKTAYDLKLVELESGLVSVDAHLPNKLFAEAMEKESLPAFRYQEIKGEVRSNDSRLDFRLSGPFAQVPGTSEVPGTCWVETKSVTLVEEGVALFPDAPTKRGSRHLRELMALRQEGERTTVVFVVQRADAHALAPHRGADPIFAQTLRKAVAAGVEAWAYTCHVTLDSIYITGNIPVQFPQ